MSGKGGGGNNGGKWNNGISGIPAVSKKMVQSLKEIVNNCTEQEIYATLKECNMNPDEAVNRLLSQDPFHEVKSKREKKKENKDTSDSRLPASSDGSIRSSKGITDRSVGRGRSSLSSYSESGVLQSKLPNKKENGMHGYLGSSSSAYVLAGNSMNQQASSRRDTVATENNILTSGVGDGITLSLQPSFSYQPAWSGVPAQVSMADIVKRGRLQSKGSVVYNPPNDTGSHSNDANFSHQNWQPSSEQGIPSQKIPPNDKWPMIEPLPATHITVAELATGLEMYSDPSRSALDGANQHIDSEEDEAYDAEDSLLETINENANHIRSTSVSGRSVEEDGSGRVSVIDSNLYTDLSSYQPHVHGLESKEEEDGASVSANLQQLTLQNYGQSSPSEEDNPSLVIPDHLQLHTPDCFHLSFGSFGSGAVPFLGSGSFSSGGLKSNVEEIPVQTDVQSIGHSDNRNSEYYGDGHLRSTLDGNLMHRSATSADTHDSPATKPEGLKQEIHEESQAEQYVFPPSAPRFPFESNDQSNAQFTHHQMSSQMQNLTNFSSVMQAYSSLLPSSLLASNVQTARDDFPYSPFPVTQSVATKYSNVASSITGPTISMSEALRASSIQNHQPAAQTLPSAGVTTGPSLPQHLALHPYSQPTLPLGHFANMIGYPFLPQSYAYMPSAFQQAYAGNNTYHQSLAAVLPQYKSSASVSSLPQSAAVAGYGSSTNIPGGDFQNTPAPQTGTAIGYDDVTGSQYKDNSHLVSPQQSDNPAMWVHGPGSRTLSGVPASTYYSFQQGQNQQEATFRQSQQQSQHYGALGYQNVYHSQAGMSLDNQHQQGSRDQSLNISQGQAQKQQSRLIWQNGY